MKEKTLTRRDVISLLGIKLPVVLLAVETLPGIARAGEAYTRKTFRTATTYENGILKVMDSRDEEITITTQFDADGRPIGSRIQAVTEGAARHSHLEPGSIIYKVNNDPFIIESQDDFEDWRDSIIDMARKKQTITLDLDVDKKPFLYVIEFE
jgi:hypothetical protein